MAETVEAPRKSGKSRPTSDAVDVLPPSRKTGSDFINYLDGTNSPVSRAHHTKGCCNRDGHFCTGCKRKFSPNAAVLAWQKHNHEFEMKQRNPESLKHESPRGDLEADLMDNASKCIVAGKYHLIERIGNGSFGVLYRARDAAECEEVAVKVECVKSEQPLLEGEAKIYKLLAGAGGFPNIRYYGTEKEVNILVLDLLGPTLEDLLNFCRRTFSLKTTVMLAEQMLSRLETVHQNCYVHRDIKPDNFLMGLGTQRSQVFLIDFGLAKKFYNHYTGRHIDYCQKRDLVGTPRFSSVRSHFAEQGRRDDLESLGYVLIYFRRGRLPWQGIRADTKAQKFEQIAEMKASIKLDSLCDKMPDEFFLYLRYCRCLHFDEMPDYMYLHSMFQNILFRWQWLNDLLFDWVDPQHLATDHCDCTAKRGRQITKKSDNCCSCSCHKYKRRLDHQGDGQHSTWAL